MTIVYICPIEEKPTGGVKVIYQHCEILAKGGVPSEILHPEQAGYRCPWFDRDVEIRTTIRLNPREDYVVVPEAWAAFYGRQFLQAGIRYAIFVQNGYLIRYGRGELTDADLAEAYAGADRILSISEDTTRVITFKYPRLDAARIVRLSPGIPSVFRAGPKERLVTYMPRKLPDHCEEVLFLLGDRLPPGWRAIAVDGLAEQGVVDVLARSSIFMSFCWMEGCGLPPLEAALSGNIVVGYTGQGANEYFAEPLFHRIENGDFVGFAAAVSQAVADLDGGRPEAAARAEPMRRLRETYSLDAARERVLAFGRAVQSGFARRQ